MVTIVPANVVYNVDYDALFLVKDFTFNTPSGSGQYPYIFQTASSVASYVDMVPVPPGGNGYGLFGDLANSSTLAGQGNWWTQTPPSEKVFGNHVIVKYGATYYDPSYGVTYSDEMDFENKAVAGYASEVVDQNVYGKTRAHVRRVGRTTYPFVTSVNVTGTNLRNDFTGAVGFKFTVGASPIVLTQLGRWIVNGNSGWHRLRVVNSNGTDAVGGTAQLNTLGQTANAFAFANLPNGGLKLAPNTSYFLVSDEVSGGDHWYDWTSTLQVKTASRTSMDAAVYSSGGGYTVVTGSNKSYCPLSFQWYRADIMFIN